MYTTRHFPFNATQLNERKTGSEETPPEEIDSLKMEKNCAFPGTRTHNRIGNFSNQESPIPPGDRTVPVGKRWENLVVLLVAPSDDHSETH